MTVNEILERMKDARSWKEADVTMDDVKEVLSGLGETTVAKYDSAEIRRLKNKVDRLTESNKQLMAENKKLKGGN